MPRKYRRIRRRSLVYNTRTKKKSFKRRRRSTRGTRASRRHRTGRRARSRRRQGSRGKNRRGKRRAYDMVYQTYGKRKTKLTHTQSRKIGGKWHKASKSASVRYGKKKGATVRRKFRLDGRTVQKDKHHFPDYQRKKGR